MKVFWKFNFSHRCTLIVGIFDNLNRNFDKRPKIVAQCPKLTKNHSFFNNFFSSNWSYGHVDCSFDNCVKQFWQKAVFFVQSSKTLKSWSSISIFFPKRSYGHVECSFDNCAKNFWQKANFFVQSSKLLKKWNVFRFFFLKMFLWTHRIHFWNKFAEMFSMKNWSFLSFLVQKMIK